MSGFGLVGKLLSYTKLKAHPFGIYGYFYLEKQILSVLSFLGVVIHPQCFVRQFICSVTNTAGAMPNGGYF